MGRFYPIYLRRSDGKLETLSHGKKEVNEPTPEQLNRKADSSGICDYYREVGLDETKSLDWRRKIGGMLARHLGLDVNGTTRAPDPSRPNLTRHRQVIYACQLSRKLSPI